MNAKAKSRIVSFALALCLLLAMTLFLPGTVSAADVELGTDAHLTPDPDGSGTVPGNQVSFGEYNGSPILWRVLENAGGDALLLSENILTTMPFKAAANVWAESSIRDDLNTSLLAMLPDALQTAIEPTNTTIDGHEPTTDKLYLLSRTEAYSLSTADRTIGSGWWLRSPISNSNDKAVFVGATGLVDPYGIAVNTNYAIRPAFRLDLSSAIFISAGDGSPGDPWVVGGGEAQPLAWNDYVRIRVDSSDRLWKVIEVNGGYATLLCMESLGHGIFNSRGGTWALSDVRLFLNPETDWDYAASTFSFASGERQAITVQDILEDSITTQDRLFLLSRADTNKEIYFTGNGARQSSGSWWLRSPGSGSLRAGTINSAGSVSVLGDNATLDSGIRPAFRLDLSSVLFTSDAGGASKSGVAGASLSAAAPATGAVKLTLKDDGNLGLTVTGPADINALNSGAVSIPYTGAQTGPGRSVSVVIADSSSGEPLFYGRPVDCTTGNAAGTASFTLPAEPDLPPGIYKLLVFNEEVIGANETDYASTPEVMTLTVSSLTAASLTVTAPAFTPVTLGYSQPAAQAITITNISNDTAATITGVTVDEPAKFTVITDSNTTVPAGGGNTDWQVQPNTGLPAGAHSATITVTYTGGVSDPSTDTATAQVKFEVHAAPPVLYTPTLTATPTNLAFGNVTAGAASSPQTVTVSGADLTDVISYTITGDTGAFSLGASGWNNTSGGALEVTFTPADARAYSAALTFSSTGAADVSVPLTGSGGNASLSGGSSRSRSSSGGGPDSRAVKTPLPASAFSWDGDRTLTIDHDTLTVLGLLSVRWNGQKLILGTDFTAHQGSVIIRFSKDFIAAQAPGIHTVRVEFLNHYRETTVKLNTTDTTDAVPNSTGTGGDTHNPQTGGYDNSPWWLVALIPAAALTLFAAAQLWRRLRRTE